MIVASLQDKLVRGFDEKSSREREVKVRHNSAADAFFSRWHESDIQCCLTFIDWVDDILWKKSGQVSTMSLRVQLIGCGSCVSS